MVGWTEQMLEKVDEERIQISRLYLILLNVETELLWVTSTVSDRVFFPYVGMSLVLEEKHT